MNRLNRIQPQMPPAKYKTFQITSPVTTHFRPATCAEVGCEPHSFGWATTVPAGSEDEAIIRRAGRHFTEERVGTGFIKFTFPAGQACFKAATHKVSLGRPENFIVRDGDHRGNPRGTAPVRHNKPELWVEQFAEHQDKIVTAIERG